MFLLDFINLAGNFTKYFEVVPALTPELKNEVYHIRHAVYCEELGFESPRQDGMETDEYDAQSLHVLLRNVNNGDWVGCVRLVLARADDPQQPLPFEKYCASSLDRRIVDPAKLPRERVAEVSRLAVLARYRKRKGEQRTPVAISDRDFGTPEQPRFPYIPVGLYLGMIDLAQRHGLEHLFVLTEPRLARHLAALGVKIRRIGEGVDHRGHRVPSTMNVSGIIRGLSFFVRPLYETISAQVAQGLGGQQG